MLRDHLARSWPAAERVATGGWLLRATPTVPRGRLNSALPLVPDPDTSVVAALAAWGTPRGATRLCLEVTEGNAAIALYERLGFRRRYGYEHRLAT